MRVINGTEVCNKSLLFGIAVTYPMQLFRGSIAFSFTAINKKMIFCVQVQNVRPHGTRQEADVVPALGFRALSDARALSSWL